MIGSSHPETEWLLEEGRLLETHSTGSSHPETEWLLEVHSTFVDGSRGSSHPETEWLLEVEDLNALRNQSSSHPETEWLLEGFAQGGHAGSCSSHPETEWLLEVQGGEAFEFVGSSHPETEWLLEDLAREGVQVAGSSHPETEWLLEDMDAVPAGHARSSHPETEWLLEGVRVGHQVKRGSSHPETEWLMREIMSTYRFFMEHFGRHLISPTGNDIADTERVLNSAFGKAKGGEQRLSAGWAVIGPQGSRLQLDMVVPRIQTGCTQTRFQAFADALRGPLPVMLLAFDKKPLALDQLFVTHDVRAVRVCTPAGVETFDLASQPVGMYHRNILKELRLAA